MSFVIHCFPMFQILYKRSLTASKWIVVEDNGGGVYITFTETINYPQDDKKSFMLSMAEWVAIYSSVIEAILAANQGKSYSSHINVHCLVVQSKEFKQNWVVDIRRVNAAEGNRLTKYGFCISSMKFAEFTKVVHDVGRLLNYPNIEHLNKKTQLVLQIVRFLLIENVEKIAKLRCGGCYAGSTKTHDYCVLPFFEKIELLLADAYRLLTGYMVDLVLKRVDYNISCKEGREIFSEFKNCSEVEEIVRSYLDIQSEETDRAREAVQGVLALDL